MTADATTALDRRASELRRAHVEEEALKRKQLEERLKREEAERKAKMKAVTREVATALGGGDPKAHVLREREAQRQRQKEYKCVAAA